MSMFPGGSNAHKSSEADILEVLEFSIPHAWQTEFDLEGHVPSSHDKAKLIAMCEAIERHSHKKLTREKPHRLEGALLSPPPQNTHVNALTTETMVRSTSTDSITGKMLLIAKCLEKIQTVTFQNNGLRVTSLVCMVGKATAAGKRMTFLLSHSGSNHTPCPN